MSSVQLGDISPIEKSIYLNQDILFLAQFFLGKFLISQVENKVCITKIVETEAYKAPHDKGSHAFDNKRTKRTEIMFHEGGVSYVYLCYGIHNMLNIVTSVQDEAHAILIRAVEPLTGIDFMKSRRKIKPIKQLANGPGKLCQALGITREHNGNPYYSAKSLIWIGDNKTISDTEIIKSPRVGIAYAEECAHWPWRFRIKDNPFTSPPAQVVYKFK